jgi:ABC-type multidrug transport system ATPase subunit
VSEIFLKSSDLSLGYSNQIVIKGLDIQLSYVRDYQIIGKNGAGKTTLMNFIALNFDGTHFESNVNRSQISINQISSTSTLIQELTLSENIDYYTSETSLELEEKLNIVFKYLPEDYLNEKIKSFSSGMLRRAELSIIEIKSPLVFCIDEPLNFLDSEGVLLLANLIKDRSIANKCNILSSQEFVDFEGLEFEVINLNEY